MNPPTNLRIREWAKQVGVWLGIAVLLPLVAYYGTAAFSPPPDGEEFGRVQARLNEELAAAPAAADKDKLRAEIDRRQKENSDAERAFARRVFWVAYPVGLIGFAVGLFIPVQAVGAGLMFGGIAAMADGCYTSWDVIGRWVRVGSLGVALLVVIILGLWRFRGNACPVAAGAPTPG